MESFSAPSCAARSIALSAQAVVEGKHNLREKMRYLRGVGFVNATAEIASNTENARFYKVVKYFRLAIAVDKGVVSDRILPLTRLHDEKTARRQCCSLVYWKEDPCDRIKPLIDRIASSTATSV